MKKKKKLVDLGCGASLLSFFLLGDFILWGKNRRVVGRVAMLGGIYVRSAIFHLFFYGTYISFSLFSEITGRGRIVGCLLEGNSRLYDMYK